MRSDTSALLTSSRLGSRYLRAVLGLRDSEPLPEGHEAAALVVNTVTEATAMLAWIPPWGLALGLVLIVGRIMPTWDATKAHIAAVLFVPLVFAASGTLIHMLRAGAALLAAQRLAYSSRTAGWSHRAVMRLTTATPWVMLVQLVVGIAAGILIWQHAPSP